MEGGKGPLESLEVAVSLSFDPEFWNGRRVFITGHTGFKGGWLTFWLSLMNAEVKAMALAPEAQPNIFDALEIGDNCHHVIGDINDAALLRNELHEFSPEIVFHLAAQPLVRRSYDDPLLTFQTNVVGTANLLDACRNCDSVRSVVLVTTDKCYENLEEKRPFRESDRLGGHDPYSSSKACSELVIASYRDSFFSPEQYDDHGLSIASARAGNVIGGGDWCEDRLIPDAVRAFTKNNSLLIRMPDAVRPWQHVLEPLYGYLLLAQANYQQGPEFGCAWNFGPPEDHALSVGEIIEMVAARWSEDADWNIQNKASSKREAQTLLLNSNLARDRLGWKPNLSLDATLDMTVEWYRAFYDNASPENLRRLTNKQIERFIQLI